MKGVVLAGGTGSRLYPITKTVNNITSCLWQTTYLHPLSNLLLTGCKEILIISNPEYLNDLESLLGNGDNYGVNLLSRTAKTGGIPSAWTLQKIFRQRRYLVSLGDNFIFGSRLQEIYDEVNNQIKQQYL